MTNTKYTIGVDYGTDSVRSLLVDTSTGKEVADAVFYYPRWKEGKYCNPAINQFRQHPLDYIEGLEYTINEVVQKAGPEIANKVVAISVDTTGSTPVAVNQQSVPLALTNGYEENPNAMFVLWKDHTAVKEADEINEKAKSWGGIDYTMFEGGIYSSEWFWAKIMHVLREDEKIRDDAYSWVELCDWIPALLCGIEEVKSIKRSRCAAGHKAMWHESWGGLPSEDFLVKLDPLLKGLKERLYEKTYTVDEQQGTISKEWAQKLGLPENTIIGVGAFDAHLGAIGAEIKPNYLVKVMGTSTCDILTTPKEVIGDNCVRGICGQVDGSVLPGLMGLEAGQSAFGDVYAWFKKMLMWPVNNIIKDSSNIDDQTKQKLIEEIDEQIIVKLSNEAIKLPVGKSGELAIDWMNGRRTPDANQNLKGAIAGLSLGSDAPRIFKALVEATVFGSKAIMDRFKDEGVNIEGVIAMGGVAIKSDLVMQVMADVFNKPILVAASGQAVALGSAIAAAVAGGVHENFEKANESMGAGFTKEYKPNPANVEKYQHVYDQYIKLGRFLEKELI
ncbi:MAG: ribulokinase [Bacteroidetes bacterium]|jgi:L-ribulokinase|nr:ribulokinase [Bacteroidota bacterium]